jgi:predicted MPP superfamily phosphohydrolase
MYDIIGDVHGQAAELKLLLKKMGYERINGIYKHPKRKAVFVGDFINRGPEIKKTIRIIRAMVESGNALAILGNHEINAIIYYYKNKKNSLLGSKQDKYFLSVHKTVNEFTSEPEEWKEHIRWLRTLPIFLDFGDIRVVHACWDDQAIAKVSDLYEEGRIRKNTFRMMYQKGDSEISKCVW